MPSPRRQTIAIEESSPLEGIGLLREYVRLLKPRVMSLVVFTGLIGLYLAPGQIHPYIAFLSVFCIALGSGAAGAINMWYERHLDARMERTKYRPLVIGTIHPDSAIEFAVIMAFASVVIMAVAVNVLSAFLLLCAITYYVFIYTIWLKPRTSQNIVIGGAAGAFPPVIGWASVTGDLSIEPWILFTIIFLWTPPHFWALALRRSNDYQKAGIPMLPETHGEAETKRQIFLYALVLLPVTLIPVAIGMSGVLYAAVASLFGLLFLHKTWRLKHDEKNTSAMAVFGFSILYLAILFSALAIDKMAGLESYNAMVSF